MNPAIPASYVELGRWLENFATSHARREHPGVVARVEMDGAPGDGRSFGLRFQLGPRSYPQPGQRPVEIDAADVADGRPRFAWCDALARRIRADVVRELLGNERGSRSA